MGKVHIGFFSFTEVTDPSEHRSYNEWHQLDHMPEQYPIPGVAYGQRWVSTPACRRARAVDAAPLAPIHYMTLYLMGDPVDATLVAFRALGERLRGADRFFEHRRSRLSGPFAVTGTVAAPRVLVSADAVPFRPNRGVYVVVHGKAPRTQGTRQYPRQYRVVVDQQQIAVVRGRLAHAGPGASAGVEASAASASGSRARATVPPPSRGENSSRPPLRSMAA